jgi:hypothetical protein
MPSLTGCHFSSQPCFPIYPLERSLCGFPSGLFLVISSLSHRPSPSSLSLADGLLELLFLSCEYLELRSCASIPSSASVPLRSDDSHSPLRQLIAIHSPHLAIFHPNYFPNLLLCFPRLDLLDVSYSVPNTSLPVDMLELFTKVALPQNGEQLRRLTLKGLGSGSSNDSTDFPSLSASPNNSFSL